MEAPDVRDRQNWRRTVVECLTVAVAYVILARLGLLFAVANGNVSLIWPPAGIAIAAVTLWGPRVLPGVFAGSLTANFLGGEPWLFPLAAAVGNSLEAWLGALLLTRVLRFRCEMDRIRDIVALPLWVAPLSALVASVFGAGALWTTGSLASDALARTWFHWWLGDSIGMIVTAPVLFAFASYGLPKGCPSKRTLEAVALLAAAFFGGWILFGAAFPAWPALTILVIPLLILVALRFTLREVVLANALVAAGATIAVARTLEASLPYDVVRGMLTLCVLLLVSSLTVQILSVLLAERNRKERALLESEQKYRELVENANSIILRWSHEGKVTFLNEFGQRFFGYSAEEILGQHVVGTIVPLTETSGRDLKPLIDRICADPKAFEQNVNENVRRNGERVWIAWTNRITRDAQGQVTGILSVGTDITAQKHAQDALRRSEEQFRLITENLADLVVVLDLDGKRLYSSPSYSAILGDPDRLRGTSSFEEIHPGDRERVQAAFLDTIRTGKGHRLEYRLLDQHGNPRHIESQGSVIRDAQGRVAQAVVVSRDITERLMAERAVRELNATLERRVADRTAELEHAKERAESADRLKSAFLAAMSHELRTPLNSIIGFTGIVLQELPGPLNPEQTKQLKMVQGSARHLLALINDVLDLSKIEAGQLEVEAKPFDARESVEKVMHLVAPIAQTKKLTISADIAPEVGELLNDHRRFEQILINLINNGLKFTEKGGVRVACAVEENELVVRVRDTGIGIKPEDMGALFQAFRQIDAGLTRNHEGTGLGLSICKRLVEKMGGRIWAESEWGAGSVFAFALPISRS